MNRYYTLMTASFDIENKMKEKINSYFKIITIISYLFFFFFFFNFLFG